MTKHMPWVHPRLGGEVAAAAALLHTPTRFFSPCSASCASWNACSSSSGLMAAAAASCCCSSPCGSPCRCGCCSPLPPAAAAAAASAAAAALSSPSTAAAAARLCPLEEENPNRHPAALLPLEWNALVKGACEEGRWGRRPERECTFDWAPHCHIANGTPTPLTAAFCTVCRNGRRPVAARGSAARARDSARLAACLISQIPSTRRVDQGSNQG